MPFSYFSKKISVPDKASRDRHDKKGVALFIAVITAGTLLLIAVAISDISYKEQVLTESAKESKEAFYAADTGMECALYWDLIQGAFVGDNQEDIFCAGESISVDQILPIVVDQEEFTEVAFNEAYCFRIRVSKTLREDNSVDTNIIAYGYNTCNENNPRRLERALEVNY